MEQTERIAHYEKVYDRINTLCDEIEGALRELNDLHEELGDYYSGEWRKDFEDDEAGLIPDYVKRGVLSEDGAWDALVRSGDLLDAYDMVSDQDLDEFDDDDEDDDIDPSLSFAMIRSELGMLSEELERLAAKVLPFLDEDDDEEEEE